MTCQIEGMSLDESSVILEQVFDHAEKKQFIYEHHWTAGDFIVWDNLSVTHARTHFKLGHDRRLRRSFVVVPAPALVRPRAAAASAAR